MHSSRDEQMVQHAYKERLKVESYGGDFKKEYCNQIYVYLMLRSLNKSNNEDQSHSKQGGSDWIASISTSLTCYMRKWRGIKF